MSASPLQELLHDKQAALFQLLFRAIRTGDYSQFDSQMDLLRAEMELLDATRTSPDGDGPSR